jgi:hypothetical protein
MPSLLRLVCIASSSVLTLTSCGTTPPRATAPRLAEVKITGQRVCPSITAAGTEFTFTCNQLPTIVPSGWLLTPDTRILPNRPGVTRPNDAAVVVVTTPSRTTIEVNYVPSHRASWPQRQVTPGVGTPYHRVGRDGAVEVSSSDDGTTKTWYIAVQMWSCLEKLPLEIVNTSANGPSRSNPLSVTLFRPSADVYCPPGNQGPMADYVWIQRPGASRSQTSTPPATCPGGSSPTLFETCLVCPRSSGQSLADYVVFDGCSFADVKSRALTPETAALCSFTQVANREQCEGPP